MSAIVFTMVVLTVVITVAAAVVGVLGVTLGIQSQSVIRMIRLLRTSPVNDWRLPPPNFLVINLGTGHDGSFGRPPHRVLGQWLQLSLPARETPHRAAAPLGMLCFYIN
jgi:hypothetical protein